MVAMLTSISGIMNATAILISVDVPNWILAGNILLFSQESAYQKSGHAASEK
jgi:hypothetical protein